MEFLNYDSVDLADVLPRIPRKGRDRMQFGIVELDYAGIIIAYNMGEAKMSGRDARDMIGKNFFSDIAPCTQTPDFYGRFKAGVQKGSMSARFDFLFNHEMEPTAVRVTMMTSNIDGMDRVLQLIRVLPFEERECALTDSANLNDIEVARAERVKQAAEQVELLAVVKPAQVQTTAISAPPAGAAPPRAAPAVASLPDYSRDYARASEKVPAIVAAKPQAPRPLNLTLELLESIATGKTKFHLTEPILTRARSASAALDKAIADGEPIYGITSGFGPLLNEPADSDADLHQRSLLRHLACGVGKPFSVQQTRAAMAARLQTLLQGHSGVSDKLIMTLKQVLDEGVTPIVPQLGTVGASGDLTPLAHIALALAGEGDAMFGRNRTSAAGALSECGIAPISFSRRDALALVNGCSFSTAIAALNGARARRMLRWAMLIGSGYAQVFCSFEQALAPLLAKVRPHMGQISVREELARLASGNTRTRTKPDVGVPPHDAYTIRCQTQLFGAILDALDHHDGTVEIELNSVSDNPIINPDTAEVIHGRNFFGQHLGLVSDYLRIALIQWGQWCERAVARLVDPQLNAHISGLQPQLRGTARSSGFMGAQVTATALLAELKSAALAGTVQGVSTNANNQDIVPMATMSARHTADALEHLALLQAISVLALCQAIDQTQAPDAGSQGQFSPAILALHARIRENIPKLGNDRSMSQDIQLVASMLSHKEPVGEMAIFFF